MCVQRVFMGHATGVYGHEAYVIAGPRCRQAVHIPHIKKGQIFEVQEQEKGANERAQEV